MDTIFALASARGKAGIAVIRVSGPKAFDAVEALCGKLPEPRRASLRRLRHRDDVLDEALVITFDSGSSFTGETCAELQVHGGLATIQGVLAALGSMVGLRVAEPGEFSRRALENGCLDLTQIEGLADLIDAETEAQRRQSMAVMAGDLTRKADGWRADLIQAAALLEATIDFSDEDVPQLVSDEVSALIDKVLGGLRKELVGAAAAERIRDGFEVAIVGAPNVGKSTLLNALAGREAAITSEVAGTTRDVIEVRMDILGLPVTFLDTAGLRETSDGVERIGVAKAIDRAGAADLRLFLKLGDEELPLEPKDGDMVLIAKADLASRGGMGVSGLTGLGLQELVQTIGSTLSKRVAGSSLVIRERHRHAIERAVGFLISANAELGSGGMVELVAADLGGATSALDIMIGRVGVEDLLGEIFSRFCIGK